MDKYTICDYEEYLLSESGVNSFQISLWKTNRIDESKGIVDDYLPIINELYDALINEAPTPFNDDTCYMAYNLNKYEFKNDDVFMKNCSIIVLTKSQGDSFFNGENVTLSSEDKRMLGGKFIIRINDRFLESESGKGEFYELMSHELQHAYRCYMIFLSNNTNYKDEEKIKNDREIRATRTIRNNGGTLERKVSILSYLSERNEISSVSNELYEYIRQHEDITESNLKEHLEELPLYLTMFNFRNFLSEMDGEMKEKNEKGIIEIGNAYKRIIGDKKSTPSRAFLKLRARVIDAAMFSARLFYRTINKAFNDFGRKTQHPNSLNLAREMIESNKDFEPLNEILRKY